MLSPFRYLAVLALAVLAYYGTGISCLGRAVIAGLRSLMRNHARIPAARPKLPQRAVRCPSASTASETLQRRRRREDATLTPRQAQGAPEVPSVSPALVPVPSAPVGAGDAA